MVKNWGLDYDRNIRNFRMQYDCSDFFIESDKISIFDENLLNLTPLNDYLVFHTQQLKGGILTHGKKTFR